ncbi:MAG: RNA-binding S4 domain-containing protein [Gemmatimonadales bacterium]
MPDDSTRLDRWLWAARFYRTRRLAAEAIAGGRVLVNGARAKPGKAVKVGDTMRVRKSPYDFHLVVRNLSPRRGSASEARGLYEELSESVAARARLADQLRIAPAPAYTGKGRPTKKERRDLERLTES